MVGSGWKKENTEWGDLEDVCGGESLGLRVAVNEVPGEEASLRR